MENNFAINYHGHERAARTLLLEKKIRTEGELAVMTRHEIKEAIDEEYVSIETGENWLLIPKDKYEEFQKITEWIGR